MWGSWRYACTCAGPPLHVAADACLTVLWLDVPFPGRLGLAEEVSRWKDGTVCQSEHQESVRAGEERLGCQMCHPFKIRTRVARLWPRF